MKLRIGVLVLLWVALLGGAHAEPQRTLVLPLDGSVDPAMRKGVNASVQKAAKALPGTVTVGDTTFDETATAVGCDPAAPGCADTVRTTLGYDELVYGTITTRNGVTLVVIKRNTASAPARSSSLELTATDPPERMDAQLHPIFGGGAVTTPSVPITGPAIGGPVAPGPPPSDRRKRNKGIVLVAAGSMVFLVGLGVWSAKASTQSDIDSAPTSTAQDFATLEALESRALKLAILGDVMVVGGLVTAAYGGWTLYQDRKERAVYVAPAMTPTSAGVSIGGQW